jgi:four helix bundle protein
MTTNKYKNLANKPGFENLRIWQKAFELMKIIHNICRTLPRSEFRLKDQAERSSSSVPDQIAEGYGSYYYKEKTKCMYTARREATETQNHLRKMEAKQCITKQKADEIISEYEGLIRGINAYINYIKEKSSIKNQRAR